jgi:MSHA pilin protein MshA
MKGRYMKNNILLFSNKKKNQSGFTLIELVTVIVILGILAVVAAPKFIDLTKEARIASLTAIQGALASARDLARAKALIAGKTEGSEVVVINGQDINFVDGYPTADSIYLLMDIDANATGINSDFQLVIGGVTTSYQITTVADPTLCRAVYTYSTSTPTLTEPLIVIDDIGC